MLSTALIHGYRAAGRCRVPVRLIWQEQPLACGDSELEPDLSVICGNEDDFFTAHPTTAQLVIEVCVSGHEYERSKLRAYASAGAKEYWLVLGPEKQIEIHRQPQGEQFVEHAVHGPGGTLTSAAVPGLTVELDRLFTASPEGQKENQNIWPQPAHVHMHKAGRSHTSVYWPKLDCDISSDCLLRGAKEARRFAERAWRKKAKLAAA